MGILDIFKTALLLKIIFESWNYLYDFFKVVLLKIKETNHQKDTIHLKDKKTLQSKRHKEKIEKRETQMEMEKGQTPSSLSFFVYGKKVFCLKNIFWKKPSL